WSAPRPRRAGRVFPVRLDMPRRGHKQATRPEVSRGCARPTFPLEAPPMLRDIPFVQDKLRWMRRERIWPDGPRYLWTDAFGVLLLVSLARELGDERYLREAEHVVAEVERVLGRQKGLRIGEAPERDGQYYHYLAMWMLALGRLGDF